MLFLSTEWNSHTLTCHAGIEKIIKEFWLSRIYLLATLYPKTKEPAYLNYSYLHLTTCGKERLKYLDVKINLIKCFYNFIDALFTFY